MITTKHNSPEYSFEFDYTPNPKTDKPTSKGNLTVIRGEVTFGGDIDLSKPTSRKSYCELLREEHPDTFADEIGLRREVGNVWIKVQDEEKIRLNLREGEPEAELEKDEDSTVSEEDIAELLGDPEESALDKFTEDMAKARSVKGDRNELKILTLGAFSAQLEGYNNQPLGTSVVLGGPSGRGKNHLAEAVAQGMPDSFKFEFESASSKSFYYRAAKDPDAFHNTWIYPNEAEAVDMLIETLRPLLSKGSATHNTVDSVGENGANEARDMKINGPITATIPTIRNTLEHQLQTRLLTVELEDYEGRVKEHSKAVSEMVAPGYASQDFTPQLKKWKAALKSLTGIRRVVIPEASEYFHYDNDAVSHGARLWRNLISLMLTNAWLNQRKRMVWTLANGEKAIVASAEDYRVAHKLFEATALRSVLNFSEVHKKILDALYDLEDEAKQDDDNRRPVGKGFSLREIQKNAGLNHPEKVRRQTTFLSSSAGVIREGNGGGWLLVDGADPSWWQGSRIEGLPTPEQVEAWWDGITEPPKECVTHTPDLCDSVTDTAPESQSGVDKPKTCVTSSSDDPVIESQTVTPDLLEDIERELGLWGEDAPAEKDVSNPETVTHLSHHSVTDEFPIDKPNGKVETESVTLSPQNGVTEEDKDEDDDDIEMPVTLRRLDPSVSTKKLKESLKSYRITENGKGETDYGDFDHIK